MSVDKSSVKNHIFNFTGEFILERDVSDVMSAASSSVKVHSLKNIGEYIQRNLSNVSSVENPLFRSQHSLNNRKCIHERNSCECGIWQKSSKFKVQNSHPTVAQRIHPTEKPYKYHECGNILGFMRKFILDRSQIYMYLLGLQNMNSFQKDSSPISQIFFFFFFKKRNPILTSHQQYQSIYPGENTQQCNVCGKDLTQKSPDRNIVEPYFPDSVVVANPLPFSLYVFSDDLIQVLSNCCKSIFEEKLQRSFRVEETQILTQQR